MPRLSVIIITRNEQEMIRDCLESVKWAEEIVLVDSGSTDKTCKIAKKYRAKIVESPAQEPRFSEWRNKGFQAARGDWVLYLDADERVTPQLKKEILSTIYHLPSTIYAFAIPRRNILLGKEMHFGGWSPDYVKRLFKKDKLKRWEGKLHEEPIFEGKLGHLKEPMIHLTHRDLSSMVDKTREWSKIEAELLAEAKHPPVTWWRILRIMLTEFWQRGIKKQGWRDGTVGWIEIIFQMFSRFITYARLWEMQNTDRHR
jgi:glycosyltransferase involved in cell wall biosynthesis